MKRIIVGTVLTLICLAAPSSAHANGWGFGYRVNMGFHFSFTPYCCDNSCCPPPCYGFGPCFAPAYCGLGMAPPPAVYYDAASGMALPYQNPAMNFAPSYPYNAAPAGPPPTQPQATQPVGYYPPYGPWYGR
jgi:hypothetical protein